MNYSIIIYILGWVMNIEAAFMLLPVGVSLIYGEKNSAAAFLSCAVVCALIGVLITRKRPANTVFYARESFVTVTLCWIVMSLIGAVPFVLSREIPHIPDALFEIVSGFTTTGASILENVETMSHGMLFWRSFSHWIGGMGVLVFLLALVPLTGGQNMYLMKAESPGPSVGKLVPKLQKTAGLLYAIYFAMTVIEFLLLVIGKMPVFDALCTSLGTAGTGGFGIYADSIARYSSYLQMVVAVFMLLFGINFNFYYFLLVKKVKDALLIEEVRWYMIIFAAAVTAVTINLTVGAGHFIENLRNAVFQVASIMTTTGFSTVNFDVWPEFSRTILVMLMFLGACAGSTAGGIKVSRVMIYLKTAGKELKYQIHPRNVRKLKMDGKSIGHEVVRSANIFLIAYLGIFVVSALIISLDNFDLVTNFTAVAATLNNIGPGLSLVGPEGSFGIFSDLSKFVLIFDMLAGRLEIFPLLLLFAPATWKK